MGHSPGGSGCADGRTVHPPAVGYVPMLINKAM